MTDIPGKLIEKSRENQEIHSSRKFLGKYGKCLENDVKPQESYRKHLENCGKFLESGIEFLESCGGTPRRQTINSEKVVYKFLASCREILLRPGGIAVKQQWNSRKKCTVPRKMWETSKEQKGMPGKQRAVPISSIQLLETIRETSRKALDIC